METILCSRLRKPPVLDPYKRRILRTPDGGSISLDFEDYDSVQDLPLDAPVIILLPGALLAVSKATPVGIQWPACHALSMKGLP